jgi:hypothetical protein
LLVRQFVSPHAPSSERELWIPPALVRNSEGALQGFFRQSLVLIALALGVAGPLLAAYLIHRLHAREETPPEEVLRALDKEGLLDWDANGHDDGMPSSGSPPQEGCGRRQDEGPD